MDYLTEKKFSFLSKALPDNTFGVVRFKGSEGLSKPYEFEVLLVSTDLEIDLRKVLSNPARLVIHRSEGDDVIFHGILPAFEQLHEIDGFGFYRAFLVPKLWWLSLTQHNQVILGKAVPDFLSDVLKDGGLSGLDFEFRLKQTYEPLDYVCQYGETHLNFVSRWCEREGIYYYFEQTATGEKVVFTDTGLAHQDQPLGRTVYYSPSSGLESQHLREVVQTFHCRERLVPGSVFLKDYNYMKPSLEVSGSADVDAQNGRGRVYIYNENFPTSEAGNRLAAIRAEALLCKRKEFRGEGSVPYMAPGFRFELTRHYRRDFNQAYLTVDLDHEGNQTGFLIAGIRTDLTEGEAQVYYRNYFTAIPSTVQFRPEAKAEKPRISGTISAKVDAAAGGGEYAYLDDQGRYKVTLPFDLAGSSPGKGSSWLRMAQPYAGTDQGFHFPLLQGTEVLLTFIDGDPDRPVIAGAVPNAETASVVTGEDSAINRIRSASGSQITIDDRQGQEKVHIMSPGGKDQIMLGGGSSAWEWSKTQISKNAPSIINSAVQHQDLVLWSWTTLAGSLPLALVYTIAKSLADAGVTEAEKKGEGYGLLALLAPMLGNAVFQVLLFNSLAKHWKDKKRWLDDEAKIQATSPVFEWYKNMWSDFAYKSFDEVPWNAKLLKIPLVGMVWAPLTAPVGIVGGLDAATRGLYKALVADRWGVKIWSYKPYEAEPAGDSFWGPHLKNFGKACAVQVTSGGPGILIATNQGPLDLFCENYVSILCGHLQVEGWEDVDMKSNNKIVLKTGSSYLDVSTAAVHVSHTDSSVQVDQAGIGVKGDTFSLSASKAVRIGIPDDQGETTRLKSEISRLDAELKLAQIDLRTKNALGVRDDIEKAKAKTVEIGNKLLALKTELDLYRKGTPQEMLLHAYGIGIGFNNDDGEFTRNISLEADEVLIMDRGKDNPGRATILADTILLGRKTSETSNVEIKAKTFKWTGRTDGAGAFKIEKDGTIKLG